MRREGSLNRNTPERRKALLDSALELFVARGFDQTSIDSISERAGVTKGSVYHHFSSKEALAAELYAHAIGAIHTDIRAALSNATSKRHGIEGLVRAYLTWFSTRPTLGTFVFQVIDGHLLDQIEHVARVQRSQRLFEQQTAAWVAPLIKQGQAREVPATVLIALVIGPSRDFLRRWLRKPKAAEMKHALEALPLAAWSALATPQNL